MTYIPDMIADISIYPVSVTDGNKLVTGYEVALAYKANGPLGEEVYTPIRYYDNHLDASHFLEDLKRALPKGRSAHIKRQGSNRKPTAKRAEEEYVVYGEHGEYGTDRAAYCRAIHQTEGGAV